MAKQDRQDRRAVIDSIRKQQKGAEQRRGAAIVGACVLVAVAIVGAAAWKPISDAWELRALRNTPLAEIGAPASACSKITTKKATGNKQHAELRTPLTYEDAPPAFGKHYNEWDSMDRKLYTKSDRPELGKLVHNLEHGYTVVWYDETAAADSQMMDDLRGMAAKNAGTDNLRHKFKAAPWTSDDGDPFPKGQHIAMTHWSIGGVGETDESKQVGAFQYCSAPSGAALEEFMDKYPYMDSPEPTVV